MKKSFFLIFMGFFLFFSNQGYSQRKVIVSNNDNQAVPVKNVNTRNNPVPVINTNLDNNPVPVKSVNTVNDPALVKNVNSENEPVPVKVVNQPVANPQVKTLFMQTSTSEKANPSYGKLTISTERGETKVIEFMHCYADRTGSYLSYNIDGRGYFIQMNTIADVNSASYSAPLQIVIKNGENVSFEISGRVNPGTKYMTVSGYSIR